MYIALRLGCRFLGLTLLSVGLRSTLRPVHSQAQWAVSSLRVCKVWPSRVPEGNGVGEINGLFLGFGPSFANLGVRPSGRHLD